MNRFGVGRCCCCREISDTLLHDPVDPFTQEVGAWSYNSSDAFTDTTDDFAQLIYPTTPAFGSHFSAYVYTTYNLATPGNSVRHRLIFGWEDSSNYWFAEKRTSVGAFGDNFSVYLGRVSGGSTSYLTSTGLVSGVPYLHVCLLDDVVSAWLDSPTVGEIARYQHADLRSLPSRFGVGTGDSTMSAGNIRFRDFNLALGDSCTDCPPICQWCDSHYHSVAISLSGLTGDSCCPEIASGFIPLPFTDEDCGGGPSVVASFCTRSGFLTYDLYGTTLLDEYDADNLLLTITLYAKQRSAPFSTVLYMEFTGLLAKDDVCVNDEIELTLTDYWDTGELDCGTGPASAIARMQIA